MEHQNKSVHAVATSLIFDRASFEDHPTSGVKGSLASCNIKDVVQESAVEKECTRQRYKIILARILWRLLPAFSFMENLIPDLHPPSCQAEKMNNKSIVVPFPVMMKDEKKYSELVDVLDQLETWVHDLYKKAGRCPKTKAVTVGANRPLNSTSSKPDQPLSHVPPVQDQSDHLKNIQVPCFGDQLIRVRFAGARDLRAGSHTARDRLDHLYPFRIADWHPKRSFLKLVFKMLYKDSARQQGTLRYFREKLQRRNVTDRKSVV